jgi:translocation and assembly module TamA
MRPSLLSALLFCAALVASSPAKAGVSVEYSGIGEALEANVRARVQIERHAGDSRLSAPAAQRLAESGKRDIADALTPFGFYQPRIDITLRAGDDDWIVHYTIDPGRAALIELTQILITGPGRDDPVLHDVVAESDVQVGTTLVHSKYEALKAALLSNATGRGYFDARLTKQQMIVNVPMQSAAIYLTLETGSRYRIGEIEIYQDFLNSRIVERAITVIEGEYYDIEKLSETEFRLIDSGFYAGVELTPDMSRAEGTIVPLVIQLEPTKKNRFTAGGGYATNTGFRVRGTWDRRLVTRHGHSMNLAARIAAIRQDIGYRYLIPMGPEARITLFTGLINEELGDTTSTRSDSAVVHSKLWGKWDRDLMGLIRAERSDISEITFDDFSLIPGMRLTRATWDQLERPDDGYKTTLEIQGSANALGASTEYLQFNSRVAAYIPMTDRLRWYLRGQFGTTAVDEFPSLPASQRFFAGGDDSVRGWGFNELSPTDPNGALVGGKHLVFGSTELEIDLLQNWSVGVFFDIGNAFDDFGDALEYSTGAGFRWHSPLGLIGVDIGQALSESRSPRLHIAIRPDM